MTKGAGETAAGTSRRDKGAFPYSPAKIRTRAAVTIIGPRTKRRREGVLPSTVSAIFRCRAVVTGTIVRAMTLGLVRGQVFCPRRLGGGIMPPQIGQAHVDFELFCNTCEGRGYLANTYRQCEMCEGVGYVKTPLGEALLEFLKRHMKIKIREHIGGIEIQ